MVDSDLAMTCIELLLYQRTGQRLNDLQRMIVHLGLRGQRYLEIANAYGCTEGHAKDVGAQLWRKLSGLLGEKVTKQNLRAALGRWSERAKALNRLEPPSGLPLDPAAPDLFHWSWHEGAWEDSGLAVSVWNRRLMKFQ